MRRLLTILAFFPLMAAIPVSVRDVRPAMFSGHFVLDYSQGEYLTLGRRDDGRGFVLTNTTGLMGSGGVGTLGKPNLIATTTLMVSERANLHNGAFLDVNGFPWFLGEADNIPWIVGNSVYLGNTDSTNTVVTGGFSLLATGWIAEDGNSTYYLGIRNSDSSLMVCGDTRHGIRGIQGAAGVASSKWVPVPIPGEKIKSIMANWDIIILTWSGHVYTYGLDDYYQSALGYGSPSFAQLASSFGTGYHSPHELTVSGSPFSHVRMIAGGQDNNWAVDSNNHTWTWGIAGWRNGHSSTVGADPLNQPTDVTSRLALPTPIDTVVTDAACTHFLAGGGRLFGLGSNEQGTIGNGNQVNMATLSTPYNQGGGNESSGVLVQFLPVEITPGQLYIKLFNGIYFNYNDFAQTPDGSYVAWARDKAAVSPFSTQPYDSATENIQGTNPNGWQRPKVSRIFNPFNMVKIWQSTSQGCFNACTPGPNGGSPCSIASPPCHLNHAALVATVVGGKIQLDASGSTSGGFIAYCDFSEVSGPAVGLGISSNNVTFGDTTVAAAPVGSYVFKAVIKDENWGADSTTVSVIISPVTPAVTYFVSSSQGSASDGNTGLDSTHAFKTITHALSVATTAGDLVLMRGGDVFNETLQMRSDVSYSNYGTGNFHLSGFDTLTGGTAMGGGIYEFPAPTTAVTNLLVWNGVPMSMGRWPDTGYLNYTAITTHGLTISTAGWPFNWTGAYAVNVDDFYIKGDTAFIASQSGTGLTYTKTLANTSGRGRGVFIFNDPRTLTLTSIPGRWYNKWSVDSVQIYTPGGLGSNQAMISIRDSLVAGSSIHGASLSNCELDGANQAAIQLNNTDTITFSNIVIRYSGKNGFTGNNCPRTKFLNCSGSNLLNNGGYITGLSSQFDSTINVTLDSIGLLPGMGFGSGNGTAGYTGWSNLFGHNVWTGNRFTHLGYDGIAYSGDHNILTSNVIDYFCLYEQDGGGFYTTDPSFQSYPDSSVLTGNIATHGAASPAGLIWDSTDAAMGFYPDGHSENQVYIGNTAAYNASGGLFIHGSSIVDTSGGHYYGNGYCQVCVVEFPGTPLTGLLLRNLRTGTPPSGGYNLVLATPGTDLTSFGSLDASIHASAKTSSFRTKSSTDPGTDRSFVSFVANTGYEGTGTMVTAQPWLFLNSGTSTVSTYVPRQYLTLDGAVIFRQTPFAPLSSTIVTFYKNGYHFLQGTHIRL